MQKHLLFFVVIHMNYIFYYFLFVYRLSNKHIKQAICTSRLSHHAQMITLFFSSTLSPSSTSLHGLDFSGLVLARIKDKNFGQARKTSENICPSPYQNIKSWPRTCPTNFFPDHLGLRDFKPNLLYYQRITNNFFYALAQYIGKFISLLPAQPIGKIITSFLGLLGPVKKSSLVLRPDPCRPLSSRLHGEREQTEKVHSKIIFFNSINSNIRKSIFFFLLKKSHFILLTTFAGQL